MISHKYKFIFVHIPRTAGTSITNALASYSEDLVRKENDELEVTPIDLKLWDFWPKEQRHQGWYKHANCSEIEKAYGREVFNSYFKFSCVRNPWERFASIFYYNQRVVGERAAKWDFNDYVKNTLEGDNFVTRTTSEKMIFASGKLAMNKIIRHESLQEDFRGLTKTLSLGEIELPYKNKVSPDFNYKKMYNRKSKSIIEKVYQKEISEFKYSF